MCGRWRVTLNYCNTEVTIPTIEGVLVFDISLESLSNTEVTILTTEGILVDLILVLNLFPIQRTFLLPTNRYQTLFLCWPCLYSFIIIIFIQESTKQLTMKKLPIVVCFHFKVASATDYYCHSNYWDLNFRVEFIHDWLCFKSISKTPHERIGYPIIIAPAHRAIVLCIYARLYPDSASFNLWTVTNTGELIRNSTETECKNPGGLPLMDK